MARFTQLQFYFVGHIKLMVLSRACVGIRSENLLYMEDLDLVKVENRIKTFRISKA